MTATVAPELLQLGQVLGLVSSDGDIDTGWFEDPAQRLSTILTNDTQRGAALDLLQSLLGTANGELDLVDTGAASWVPIVRHPSGGALYLVIEEAGDRLDVLLGGRVARQDPALEAGFTFMLPLVSVDLASGEAEALARPAELAAALTFPGGIGTDVIDLDGVAIGALLPLDDPEQASLNVTLKGLRLPGQDQASDVSLYELAEELGPTGIRIGIGLLQAQFAALPAELGHLLALAGLDPASSVPPLPIEDVLVQGPGALRAWLSEIFTAPDSTQAWLGSLRDLFGLPPNPVGGLGLAGDPFELCFEDTDWRGCLTLVATPDPASGIITLVPGIQVTIESDGALSGGLDARLDLCRLSLGPTPSVEALPLVAFSARLEGGAGPLVDETITPPGIEVEIGSLVAGMGLRAGVLVPVFEARDVTLGQAPGDHYEVLDLTSAEALSEFVAGALDGILQQILDALGVTTSDEGRALAALAGLTEPVGASAGWPDLVSLPDLFSDPLGAIGCYHARILDAEPGPSEPVPWSLLAAEVGVLMRAAGSAAPPVTGAGTAGDPWALTLFSLESSTSPFAGEVEALIWTNPSGDSSRLHLALAAAPLVPQFAGKTLLLSYSAELLRVDLPPAASCPGPVDVSLVGAHSLAARLGTDLVFHTDGLGLSAESIALELAWESDRLGLAYEIVDPEITIEGTSVALPPLRLDLEGDLPDIDLASIPWDAVQALAGAWFTDAADDLLPNVGALLGWLPSLGDLTLRLPAAGDLELRIPAGGWPSLPLDQLAGPDPSGALRNWLGSLVASAAGDFPDLALPLIARLGRLVAPEQDGLGAPVLPDILTAPEGTGTYEDPWRLPLADDGPDLLAWVDPGGPSVAGLGGLAEHLVPQELIDAAGGTVGLTPERLVELLTQVAALHPGLREALGGLDAGAVVGSLRSALLDGDGLIPAEAQHPAGWPNVAMEPIAHLAEPAAFDASTHLPAGAPGADRRVFVSTAIPGLADWPGQVTARTIDLTAPGLAPEAFDLGAISGPGPWFVLLPGRRDAAVTQPEESPTGPTLEGADGLAGRLQRAVESAADAAGGSVCLVAHSTAGQVARVVAASADVSHLVTIGTPHGAADLSFVTDLGAGEGIRLLERLVAFVPEADLPAEAAPLLDALEALKAMTDGEVAEGGGLLNLFPAEDAASPPAFPELSGSVEVLAVVGRLLPASLDRALAALCRAVIDATMAELPGAAAADPITHLGLGLGLPLVSGIDSATQLRVEGEARLDLAHIRLQPGGIARPVPRLQVRAALRRNTGWLVGGPGVGADTPLPLDPRVRWAEAVIEADLSSLDFRSRVVLHDAAVFGVARAHWVLDDAAMVEGEEGSATLVPEARVLLGEIVARLQPLPTTGPLSDVVEVGRALRLIEVESDGSITVPPDPLERLLVDPLGELRARLAPTSDDRTELIGALRSLLGAGGSGDELIASPAEGLELVVNVGSEALGDAVLPRPTEITIRTDSSNGFTVRERLRIDGAITARGSGGVELDVRAGPSSAQGPMGRPVIGIGLSVGAEARPPHVTLSFEDATVPAMPGTVSLVPLDIVVVGEWAMRTVPALVLGHVLRWLGGLSDPVRRIVEMLGGADEQSTSGAPPPEDDSMPPGSALESAGPALRRTATRLFLGLTRDPAGWLLHPAILGDAAVASNVPAPNGATPQLLPTLSAARLEELLEVLRQGLGLTPTPGAPLSLPWGLLLDIEEAGDGAVALRLEWTPGTIASGLEAGGSLSVEIRPGLEVHPEMAAYICLLPGGGFDQAELTLGLDAVGTVSLAFILQPTGGSAITIGLLPTVSGLDALGGLAGAAAQQVLPLLLDAAGQNPTIGTSVRKIGDALGLRTSQGFDGAALVALADADASDLAARLTTGAVSSLAPLLEGVGGLLDQVSSAVTVNVGARTVTVTPFTDGASTITVTLFADLANPRLCLTATGIEPVSGKLRADLEVCLSTTGLERLRLWTEVIDDTWLAMPPVAFLPAAGVLLGEAAGADGNRVETGLWLTELPPTTGQRRGVFVRISTATGEVTGMCRSEAGASPGVFTDATGPEAIAECVREAMLAWLAPLLGELVIDIPEVTDLLRVQIAGRNIGNLLDAAEVLVEQGSGASATYDLDADLFLPDALGTRLLRLAGELATLGEIPGLDPLRLELRAEEAGDDRVSYGVGISLTEPLVLFNGDGFRLSLVNDVDWMNGAAPDVGVTIFLLQVDEGTFADPEFSPDVTIGGVGLAADNPDDVLLDVLATIAGVEINVSYQRDFVAVTPSLLAARLLIDDLTIPIGRAGGGGNPVASKMLSQGNEESSAQAGDEEELAPSLSPQLRFDFLPSPGFAFELADGSLPLWVPVQRSFGPIYVEQVGADSSNGDDPRLILLLDGGVSLEGFALGVDDLSLSIPIKRPLDLDDWQLGLAGLALGYDRNGIRIAGGFRHIEGQYAGMVQVEAAQFGLTAVGAYGEFPVNSGSSTPTYTSFFIFGALSAPLGGPPAFFVTGIGAGVGLNRRLAIPDEIDQVPDFTLVKAMDPSSGFASNPLGSLEGLIDDFPVERGTFWLAAGIRFTSFALVESLAVLTVEIGDHLEINLLGLSSADLPSKQLTLARVELALRARFSTSEMLLSVEAQLTENSWILTSDCRLTGGFAFVVWFETGEFVLSLGGYHPRFKKPDTFPAVPRLGFDWSVSGALVIKGESYFALTSSCIMAGGKLEAGYTTSTVWATLTFGADAIFSWDPFFYEVSAYARVSAGIRIRICFFACATIRLSFSIGADVLVKGPDLSGRATLDLDVISVTVSFGASEPSKPPALSWSKFHEKYLLQGDPADVALGLSFVSGLQPPDPSTTTSDTPPDDGTSGRPWRVLPEFVFVTNSRAASMKTVLAGNGATKEVNLSGAALGLAPMKLSNVTSVHSLTLFADDGDVDIDKLDFAKISGKVPEAIWLYASDANEPTEPRMRDAIVGATVAAHPEIVGNGENEIQIDQTQTGDRHPLPFHDEIAARPFFVAISDSATDYRLAQPQTTDAVLSATTIKALGTSNFERRVLTAELTTPPRLAALGEGMVDDVLAPAAVTPVVIEPETPRVGEPGRPNLIGVLRGGPSMATEETILTTVSAEVRKQVSAGHIAVSDMPTIAAVESAPPGEAPIRLELTGTRLVRAGRTMSTAGEPPVTHVAGSQKWAVHGTGGSGGTLKTLRALENRLERGVPLIAGDVTVWQIPGSQFDGDDNGRAEKQRPRWMVAGTQQVRTVMLDRAGRVVADRTGAQYVLEMPVGGHRIVTLGVGVPPADKAAKKAAPAGIDGWQETTTLAQVASGVHLGPRCVVTIDGGRQRARRSAEARSSVNLAPAGAAIAGADLVSTRLPAGTTAVAVLLDGVDELRCGDALERDLIVRLDGAAPDGRAPRVLATENRLTAIYGVRPRRGADAVTVHVSRPEHWRLAGVVGGGAEREALIGQLEQRDVSSLLGPLVSTSKGIAQAAWRAPGRPKPDLTISEEAGTHVT